MRRGSFGHVPRPPSWWDRMKPRLQGATSDIAMILMIFSVAVLAAIGFKYHIQRQIEVNIVHERRIAEPLETRITELEARVKALEEK